MTERERADSPVENKEKRQNTEKAEKHAKETGVPTGATPEAVAEEEATGGALTNRKD